MCQAAGRVNGLRGRPERCRDGTKHKVVTIRIPETTKTRRKRASRRRSEEIGQKAR